MTRGKRARSCDLRPGAVTKRRTRRGACSPVSAFVPALCSVAVSSKPVCVSVRMCLPSPATDYPEVTQCHLPPPHRTNRARRRAGRTCHLMFYVGEAPTRAGAAHRRPATITCRDISPGYQHSVLSGVLASLSRKGCRMRGAGGRSTANISDNIRRTGGRNVDSVKELTKDNV